jgi:hypothetical protein
LLCLPAWLYSKVRLSLFLQLSTLVHYIRALSTSNSHTAAEKLSRLTISTLAIFFGVTSFATTVLLEPQHEMGALAMDVTAARLSVKVANPAHPVPREGSNASSKGMR